MFLYILSALFLLFVLMYEPKVPKRGLGNYHIHNMSENQTYFVSLVTLKNNANAPFYYHTSLELIKKGGTPDTDEKISYGFYPDFSNLNLYKPLKPIYRFLRPIYAMPARIRSPDILYEGSDVLGIGPGKVVYRENYPVTEKEWLNLKYQIARMSISNDLPFPNSNATIKSYEMPLYYSYAGSYLSDNCSSWVRKILNKYLKVNMSCQLYRFELFGLSFAAPLSPFDFPPFCSSPSSTLKTTSSSVTGYANTTHKR